MRDSSGNPFVRNEQKIGADSPARRDTPKPRGKFQITKKQIINNKKIKRRGLSIAGAWWKRNTHTENAVQHYQIRNPSTRLNCASVVAYIS